jgi:hypothetical protein
VGSQKIEKEKKSTKPGKGWDKLGPFFTGRSNLLLSDVHYVAHFRLLGYDAWF